MPATPRRDLTCFECGLPVLVKDIFREHTVPGGVEQYLCRTCQRKRVDRMIARNRRELGLDDSRI